MFLHYNLARLGVRVPISVAYHLCHSYSTVLASALARETRSESPTFIIFDLFPLLLTYTLITHYFQPTKHEFGSEIFLSTCQCLRANFPYECNLMYKPWTQKESNTNILFYLLLYTTYGDGQCFSIKLKTFTAAMSGLLL